MAKGIGMGDLEANDMRLSKTEAALLQPIHWNWNMVRKSTASLIRHGKTGFKAAVFIRKHFGREGHVGDETRRPLLKFSIDHCLRAR